MIEVKDIDVFYGNIQALKRVSLSVEKGSIVALIGSNGAGKSTLTRAIVGLLRKKSGDVYFDSQRITLLPTADIIRLGISVVPEARRLFGPLSVIDNLRLGAYLRLRDGQGREVEKDLDAVCQLFPLLKARSRQSASTLSGGEQQMLAIGRSLMMRPKAILMDEPSIGLAPLIVQEIFGVIKRLKEEENTILLIEQNARAALKVSDWAYVMELGRITLKGDVQTLLETDTVKKLYLGA
ncbi:MAG: ABC transporter ATP-binding protein [Desulfobacteraceae bacterium]|nr:ABC transporter ATP-binding protein [Desulfobacteraceae bacterium]